MHTLPHGLIGVLVLYQTINLCKEYGNPRQAVLNQVNLQIPKGSLFGLLGPNGAGKTTLLSILIGLTPKTSGQVLVNDVKLEDCLEEVRSTTGVVPQDLALYPMLSAHDNLNFFADVLGLKGAKRAQNIEFAVTTTALNNHLHKKAQNFSGGLKRRLNIAIGLLNQPSVLFLDEPTVGIDPQTRNFILESIKSLNRQGVTIIYTSHYMDEVQKICNRVAIIDRGTILIQDEINQLLHRQGKRELRVDLTRDNAEQIAQQLAMHCPARIESTHSIAIETAEPLAVLQAIADTLPEAANAIEHISYGNRNLEDLFLSLTGSDTRDNDAR